MTPTEQYSQKRAEAISLIEQHAPARLQTALIALLRPAIALSATRAEDAQIPLGASKFGGAPDVPADFEWPTWENDQMAFLGQVNLAEAAPFDVENKLPKSGLLSFFAGDENWIGEAGRVYWFEETSLYRIAAFESHWRLNPCLLSLVGYCEVPSFCTGFFPKVEPGTDEWDELISSLGKWPEKRSDAMTAKILGYSDDSAEFHVANSLVYKNQPYIPPEDWIVLFEIFPPYELAVEDWGEIYGLHFLTDKQSLAERRFNNIKMERAVS